MIKIRHRASGRYQSWDKLFQFKNTAKDCRPMRCGPQLRTDAGRQYRSKQVLYLLRAFCEVHKINDSFRTNAYTIVDLPLRRAHGLRGGGPLSPLHPQALLPEASDKSICAYPSTILSPHFLLSSSAGPGRRKFGLPSSFKTEFEDKLTGRSWITETRPAIRSAPFRPSWRKRNSS